MSPRVVAPLCVFAAVALGLLSRARADASFMHVVRPGETLASIAQRYYGDPRREGVLVAENGLAAQGGSAIVVGMRLVIPWVDHHAVQEGETWAAISERYYGDPRGVGVLMEANGGGTGGAPDVGAELIVPYPLRHVAGQSEHLRRVAQDYYGSEGPEHIRRLRRFNQMRGVRPARGQVVLVPLSDLLLSEEGRRLVQESSGRALEGGLARARQAQIDEELPTLREHVRRGRFTEAVALGNRLVGAGRLTGNQVVSIQRELGTAYVALGRSDLATSAFVEALQRQHDLELDVARTSPTVLRAFQEAKERFSESQAAGAADPTAAVPLDAGARSATP